MGRLVCGARSRVGCARPRTGAVHSDFSLVKASQPAEMFFGFDATGFLLLLLADVLFRSLCKTWENKSAQVAKESSQISLSKV
jgi:hypothetical protein